MNGIQENPPIWVEPVCDRTREDVELLKRLTETGYKNFSAEQKELWLSGMKGALNKSDLQRIENNCEVLSELLELGIQPVETVPDLPDEAYFHRLTEKVAVIREAYCVHADTPEVPVSPLNTYRKINDLERILMDVYGIISQRFFYYCGEEISCGEAIGFIL